MEKEPILQDSTNEIASDSVESPVQRPQGGHDDDLSELSNKTLMDIYTTPGVDAADADNALAEINQRKNLGVFNLDDSADNTIGDLSKHGYAVRSGKILYPTPEYKAWLQSDRTTSPPNGVIRESISDRIESEKRTAERAQMQARGEAVIQAYIDEHEDEPSRKKIPKSSHNKSQEYIERKTEKKESDIEIDGSRRVKNKYRFDNNFFDPELAQKAEKEANLPIYEEAAAPVERAHKIETDEEKAEKLYNQYEQDFEKTAPKWITFGVTNLLEKGVFNAPTEALLVNGFKSREDGKIHERFDPDNTFSLDAFGAESDFKNRVVRDLISKQDYRVPEEDIAKSRRKGLLYAIYSGARIDRDGQVIYSIPFDQNEQMTTAMKENGINTDSKDVQFMSYCGFIDVVEAIKDNDKGSEKGFKALDWYFDTFDYKKHMSEFIDIMDEYQETADRAFGNRLDEYLAQKEEFLHWQEQQKNEQDKDIEALAGAEYVSRDEFITYIESVRSSSSIDGIDEIFPYPDSNEFRGKHVINTLRKYPSATEKCTKLMQELTRIQKLDPNVSYALVDVFGQDITKNEQDNNKKQTKPNYTLLRFGYNSFNCVVAAPICNQSKALFYWKGKTGDDMDGWREYFTSTSVRNRPEEVKRAICRGYSKKGFLALGQQWARAWSYFNEQ